jgi:hypothetical protein
VAAAPLGSTTRPACRCSQRTAPTNLVFGHRDHVVHERLRVREREVTRPQREQAVGNAGGGR